MSENIDPGTNGQTSSDNERTTHEPLYTANNTEAVMARNFARERCDIVRSVPQKGDKWLAWRGHFWAPDSLGDCQQVIKAWLYDRHRTATIEAAEQKPGAENQRDKLQSAMTNAKITSLTKLALTEPSIRVHLDDLDAQFHLIATPSGTVDLKTGELKDPDPADLITMSTRVAYVPNARAQRFAEFLDEVTGGDKEVQNFLQLLAGYWLTGSVEEQVLTILFGTGANGKGVFTDTLKYAMGDYAMSGSPGLLIYSVHEQHSHEVAELQGKRFVVHEEMEAGQRMAESKVKRLTAEKTLKGRFMRQNNEEFWNTTKHVLSTNHLPRIQGDDYAIARRMLVVPFSKTFEGPNLDPRLGTKLEREAVGVLAWMIQGAVRWYGEGLGDQPYAVKTQTADYVTSQDPLGAFLDECTEPGTSQDYMTFGALQAAYMKWDGATEDSGTWLKVNLPARLVKEGYTKERRTAAPSGKRLTVYTGIKEKK